MSDTKGIISRAFSGKEKPRLTMTEDELLEEYTIRSHSGIKALREERNEFKQRAETAEEEIKVQKHEYEGKLVMVRSENASLRKQLDDVGAKMERYQTTALRLKQQVVDLEMFFRNELTRLVDHLNHAANGNITYAGGLASTVGKFLDQFHQDIEDTEYAKPALKPKELEPLHPEDERKMKELAVRMAPRPQPKPAPLPPFLTKQEDGTDK